jgi:hypothetical protein
MKGFGQSPKSYYQNRTVLYTARTFMCEPMGRREIFSHFFAIG